MKVAASVALSAMAVNGLRLQKLSEDLDADKNRPVSKVITLLKDMQTQLQKEMEADQDVYDKMACWCKTNDAEKTKAIEEAEARIQLLTAAIEEHTANSSRLNAEIKNLNKEVSANQGALAKATALRKKQLAEFNGEEKDMLEAITALKSAITVLSKHHAQKDETALMGVQATLSRTMKKHAALLAQVITPSQKRKVMAFVEQGDDYLAMVQTADKAAPHLQQYAPQSGEIFGILNNMLDTFKSNLSDSQKEEMANAKAFEELKAAKEDEIKAGQDQIAKKEGELADTDEKNAQAKEDVEDTRNALSANEQFLMDLKEKCQLTDQEWEQRQKTRNEEIQAVAEALTILASDDAHDTFTRTFNTGPSFIQKTSVSSERVRASELLKKVGIATHSPKMSTLAMQVRLDSFTRVKKAIDDMVTQLLKEKEDEIKHRDWCIDGLHENEAETERKSRDKSDLEAKIADLESTISSLSTAIETLEEEITEMQKQLKRRGEDREKENAEFQTTIADQRETRRLLQRAVNVLKSVYEQKGTALNQQEPVGPPPPAGFKTYEKSSGSSGVISMLKQIISDTNAMEAETVRSEEDAQKAYEDFVKDTNNSIEQNQHSITNKKEARATAEGDKTEAETQHEGVVTELEQLANHAADMHKSCDFVLKNFEIRQEARDQEVEALRQAKAILSGADFQ